MERNSKLLVRSRKYGIGKDIAGAVYLHRRYEALLGEPLEAAKKHLPPDFEYTVVKYVARQGKVSFIQSPDFDSGAEPTVGDSIVVHADGRTARRKAAADPEIYHHKWLFVADDYDGFDVEASKRRSAAWLSLSGIDKRRIGRRGYWEENVLPRLKE